MTVTNNEVTLRQWSDLESECGFDNDGDSYNEVSETITEKDTMTVLVIVTVTDCDWDTLSGSCSDVHNDSHSVS